MATVTFCFRGRFFLNTLLSIEILTLCRFDLLAGFNAQESGGFSLLLKQFLSTQGENITDGGSLDAMIEFTKEQLCKPMVTKFTVELCGEYIVDLYEMGASTDPVQRVKNFLTAMSM